MGKNQDLNMKCEPQLVLSNSNKSTKWHDVTGVLSPFVNSHVAPKYSRHGKRPEHGIAGSVGKDQDTNMKFTP